MRFIEYLLEVANFYDGEIANVIKGHPKDLKGNNLLGGPKRKGAGFPVQSGEVKITPNGPKITGVGYVSDLEKRGDVLIKRQRKHDISIPNVIKPKKSTS